MNMILRMARVADAGHEGQKRKFTGRPYVEHCDRVAARTARHRDSSENMVCAAWAHDLVEDTEVTLKDLSLHFPGEVVQLVGNLTNPSKQHPDLSRADKKAMDRAHLRTCGPDVRLIKMVDRTDNLTDAFMNGADASWLTQYAKESYALFTLIFIPHDPVTEEFREILRRIQDVNEITDAEMRSL